MLAVQRRQHHLLFVVEQHLEPSIQSCSNSFLSHGCNWLCHPSLVGWIHQTSSAFSVNTSYDALPFWSFCPAPSWFQLHSSGCKALYLLQHHPRLHHLPHCQMLYNHSDYLHWGSTSPQVLFQAFWMSIAPFQYFSYLPGPAELLSLGV